MRPLLRILGLLILLCGPAFTQQSQVVTVGITPLTSRGAEIPGDDARDDLVKALTAHKADAKLSLSFHPIPLNAAPGAPVLAEAKSKRCEFVVYLRLDALEKSIKSGTDLRLSPQNLEHDTVLLEYEIKSVGDGATFALGTAKGGAQSSVRDAIAEAIRRLPNKLEADLSNPEYLRAASDSTRPAALPSAEESLGTEPCARLPKSLPHVEAVRQVCEYASTESEKIPNFLCEQDTARYLGRRRVPTDFVTATIRFVDGEESFRDLKRNGRPLPEAMWNTAGLWSSGQLEGNLRAIFQPGNHAHFEFSGESKIGDRKVWVFTYQIARQYEPLWKLRAEDQLAAPPYEGELWIEEKTGTVLRFRSTAKDLSPSFPIHEAEIVTDYDNVIFPDSGRFVLPVESTVTTRYRDQVPIRNVVEFRDCRKFRATTRVLLDGPEGSAMLEASSSQLSPQVEAAENEEIYAILRQNAVDEDDIRLAIEQRQQIGMSTGAVFWKLAQLRREQEKLQAAKPARPASTYEIVSHSNGTTTFRVNVHLVPVSIVVRDHQGRAVGNLKQDDFQLLADRKAQEIVSFSMEKGAAQNSLGVISATPANSLDSNNVAYVFDDLHTPDVDLGTIKAAAERHLAQLPPGDRIALFTISGEVRQDFTDDREKLKAALRRVKSHFSQTPADCPVLSYYVADLIVNEGDESAFQAASEDALECLFPDARSFVSQTIGGSNFQQANAVKKASEVVVAKAYELSTLGRMESDRTLGMLHEIMGRLESLPGRRTILLLSPGFLTMTRNEQEGTMYLIERALHAGVVVSAVDVRGLPSANLAPNRSHLNESSTVRTLDSQELDATGGVMQDLAYGTGGIYFHNNNDLDEGLRRASEAPEFVYVLGFAPPRLDGKFHKLKVTVKGSPKFVVQARQGYYALKPSGS